MRSAGSSLPTTANVGKISNFNARLSFKTVRDRKSRDITIASLKGQSYNVEVECNANEDPEGALKRFRNSCNQAGMVYEARKRQFFENRQDIKKRKQQEKGLHKMRAQRERFLVTYGDSHSEAPPFMDLFQGQDDIYDIIGDISDSYDDDVFGSGRRRARRVQSNSLGSSNNDTPQEANPAAEQPEDETIIQRSVQPDGNVEATPLEPSS